MRVRLVAGVVALAALAALPAGGAELARLSGVVRLEMPGLRIADLGPMVVYLEPTARAGVAGVRSGSHEIRQRNARFAPGFLAVSRGDAVSMPNDDTIYHNVFSFSESNAFDLGLYAAGESRVVRFDHPGVVRIYCSIHESMNGLLFVAPTPWFARPDAEGRFSLEGVPAGRWRLRVWAEKLPPLERTVELRPGENRLELPLRP